MELTNEQLEAIKKEIGEKRFEEITNVIKYNRYKLYLYKKYKLHETNEGSYTWIDLDTSCCFANGTLKSAEDAIKRVGQENVKEFSSFRDAIKSGYFDSKISL